MIVVLWKFGDTTIMTKPKPIDAKIQLDDKYMQSFEKQHHLLSVKLVRQNIRVQTLRDTLSSLTRESNPRLKGVCLANVAGAERGIRITQGQLEFLRPSSELDVQYRLRVYEELPRHTSSKFSIGSEVRFHGTELPRVRDILASGEISSSVDRDGVETSYDVSGQISVTEPSDISTTVHNFSGMLTRECALPAGCIFALMPSSKEDALAGRSHLMGNVYFREQPELILGILTSPENIPRVQEWAESAGLNPEAVQEFFKGVDMVANLGATY